MASVTLNHRVHGLNAAIITVASIVFLTILLSRSVVDSVRPSHSETSRSDLLQKRELVLGSRPPGCENKCLNCKPCVAILVIPSHHKPKRTRVTNLSSYHDDEDDSYYLLSWKCKCGQRLFQP